MRKLIIKLGRFWVVLGITLVSILLSLTAAWVMMEVTGVPQQDFLPRALPIAVIVLALVAPLVSWYLVGLFIRVHSLEAEMRQLASFDELTGVRNRRSFLDLASSYFEVARRNQQVFSLLLLDLDHFKFVNDNHGHLGGDAVLRQLGRQFLDITRKSDMLGRFGGEEFIFLLPETGADELSHFTERLHGVIRDDPIDWEEQQIHVTASIGITVFDQENCPESLNLLIKQADDALYRAKREGRNCSCRYSPTLAQMRWSDEPKRVNGETP